MSYEIKGNALNGDSENSHVISYNSTVARGSLTTFCKDMNDIIGELGVVYAEFMETMKEYFASPEAVKITTESKLFEQILKTGKASANTVIRGATAAVAAMAQRAHSSFSFSDSVTSNVPDSKLAEESMNGWYGIDSVQIEQAKDKFKSQVERLLGRLDSVQSSISANTPNNAVKHLYEFGISAMKGQIENESKTICSQVESKLDEYNNNVKSAISEACTELDQLYSSLTASINA